MARPKYSDTEKGRQRQEEKYHRILDAALEVFADKGFYEAKVTEIARVAGVADGTIYLYFKNKDDLVVSLVENMLGVIVERLRDSVSGIMDARDRVHHMIRFHLCCAHEQPTLTRFMTIELRRSSSLVREHAQKPVKAYVEMWTEIFEEGKRQGHFRPELHAGVFGHLVFGALDYACTAWVGDPERSVEQLNLILREATETILRAVAVSPEAVRWNPSPDLMRTDT
jgi:TetR/AcrR family fatty acid metabolism transcriptional regulator